MDTSIGKIQDAGNEAPGSQHSGSRIKWHSGFREAFDLYFDPYRALVDIQWEYPLTAEALKLDALITKKDGDSLIPKGIGSFFRTWNMVEYVRHEVAYLAGQDMARR